MCSSYLRSGGLCSTFLWAEHVQKLFGIFMYGRFVHPTSSIDLLFLYQYRVIFCVLQFIVLYCFMYFIAHIFPALPTGGPFHWLLCPSCVLHHSMVLFLSTSLLPCTTSFSKLILCIPCPSLRASHFSKEHWPLLLERGVRNRDLGATCAHCYWVSLVLEAFLLRSEYYICTPLTCEFALSSP